MVTRRIKSDPSKVTGTVATGQKFESTLEEDFFVLLRFNPWVVDFEVQPLQVPWTDKEGKRHIYTPDVLVRYRSDVPLEDRRSPMLCEVKPDLDAEGRTVGGRTRKFRKENPEHNTLKWEAAEHFAAAKGWNFKVYYESDIRTPYLENARFLLAFLERPIEPRSEMALLNNLARMGPMTAGDLLATITTDRQERAMILPTFYRLVATRGIEADLTEPFTLKSTVQVPEH